MRGTRTRNWSILTLALLGVLAAVGVGTLVGTAQATPPGENGQIAFRRYFNDEHSWGAIFVSNADGTGVRQVTRPRRGVFDDQPDWSPNGSLLAFSRCAANGLCGVYTVRPDGTKLKRLSTPLARTRSHDTAVSFLPDGRHVVFTRASGGVRTSSGGDQVRHSDVVVMDLNGKNRRVIARAPLYAADYENPLFSPDGTRFVYEHRRSHFVDRQTRRALMVTSANGKSRQRITPWSMNAGDGPDWSPDGTLILFRSNEDGDDETQSQIYTIRPDGTDLRQLTHVPNGTLILSSTFSPDGQEIVFSMAGKAGAADVYVMQADGTDTQPVTQTALWDSAPDWGPAR
jgi:TolB protein